MASHYIGILQSNGKPMAISVFLILYLFVGLQPRTHSKGISVTFHRFTKWKWNLVISKAPGRSMLGVLNGEKKNHIRANIIIKK